MHTAVDQPYLLKLSVNFQKGKINSLASCQSNHQPDNSQQNSRLFSSGDAESQILGFSNSTSSEKEEVNFLDSAKIFGTSAIELPLNTVVLFTAVDHNVLVDILTQLKQGDSKGAAKLQL